MTYDKTLRWFFSLMTMLVYACDDDTTSPTGDTNTQGLPVSASEVTADPLAPVDSTNVQAWLESLLQLHQQHAITIQQLEETAVGHADRLDALESTKVDVDTVSLVAAEVGFDDNQTTVKGTTVQTFGESLDQYVTQVKSTLTELENNLTETEGQVTSIQQEIVGMNKTLGSHDAILDQFKGEIDDLWDALQPLLDLASQPCPPEMVLVADMVCVDKKYYDDGTSVKLPWTSAAIKCMNAGKRLCSPSEFFAYCFYPADYFEASEFAAPNALKNPEWMDQLASPGLMAFNGSGPECKNIVATDAGTYLHFRCCKPPKPTLPD